MFPEDQAVLDKRETKTQMCFQTRKTKNTEALRLNRWRLKPQTHSCTYTLAIKWN